MTSPRNSSPVTALTRRSVVGLLGGVAVGALGGCGLDLADLRRDGPVPPPPPVPEEQVRRQAVADLQTVLEACRRYPSDRMAPVVAQTRVHLAALTGTAPTSPTEQQPSAQPSSGPPAAALMASAGARVTFGAASGDITRLLTMIAADQQVMAKMAAAALGAQTPPPLQPATWPLPDLSPSTAATPGNSSAPATKPASAHSSTSTDPSGTIWQPVATAEAQAAYVYGMAAAVANPAQTTKFLQTRADHLRVVRALEQRFPGTNAPEVFTIAKPATNASQALALVAAAERECAVKWAHVVASTAGQDQQACARRAVSALHTAYSWGVEPGWLVSKA